MLQRLAVLVGTALLLAGTAFHGLPPLAETAATAAAAAARRPAATTGAGPHDESAAAPAGEQAPGSAAPRTDTSQPAAALPGTLAFAGDHQPSPLHLLTAADAPTAAPLNLRRPRVTFTGNLEMPHPGAASRRAQEPAAPITDPQLVRLTKDRGS